MLGTKRIINKYIKNIIIILISGGLLFIVYLQAGSFFGSNDKKVEKMEKRITSVESEVKSVRYQIDSLSRQVEQTMAILMAIKELEGYGDLSQNSNEIEKRKSEFLSLFDQQKYDAQIDSLSKRLDSLEKANNHLSKKLENKNQQDTIIKQEKVITKEKNERYTKQGKDSQTKLINKKSSPENDSTSQNKSQFIQNIYDKALKLHRKGEHDLAIEEFKKIINTEVDTELADNSQFWIADCYFKQGEYQKAIKEFNQVIEEYDNTNKKDDVLYNLGKCYTAIGEKDKAKKYLQELIENYPDSEFFNLAIKRVKKL